MSQICELTGKRPGYGNRVSHSNIKTPHRWMPNLKRKKFYITELGMHISLLLSTRAIRTADKFGNISNLILDVPEKGLSKRLAVIRRKIYKKRVAVAQPKKK